MDRSYRPVRPAGTSNKSQKETGRSMTRLFQLKSIAPSAKNVTTWQALLADYFNFRISIVKASVRFDEITMAKYFPAGNANGEWKSFARKLNFSKVSSGANLHVAVWSFIRSYVRGNSRWYFSRAMEKGGMLIKRAYQVGA